MVSPEVAVVSFDLPLDLSSMTDSNDAAMESRSRDFVASVAVVVVVVVLAVVVSGYWVTGPRGITGNRKLE